MRWIYSAACLALASVAFGVDDIPFAQDVSHRSTFKDISIADWEQLPFKDITSTLHLGTKRDCFIALADGGLYASSRYPETNKILLQNPYSSWHKISSSSFDNAIALATSHADPYSFFIVTSDNILGSVLSPASAVDACGTLQRTSPLLHSATSWENVIDTTSSPYLIWIASSALGLTQISIVDGEVTSLESSYSGVLSSLLWVQHWNDLFVATDFALYTYHYSSSKITAIAHEWVGGIIDFTPNDMAYDSTYNVLFVSETDAVHRMDADGKWWRLGLHQGLPLHNITSVGVSNGVLYVGSMYGLAKTSANLDATQVNAAAIKSSDPWSWIYFEGHRYLPSDTITAIVASHAAVDGSCALIITDAGVALLDSTLWTLQEKALSTEQFQYPRHDRRGLTADVSLVEYGDVSSYVKKVGDNDGLWTAMHGMGEAYRYMTTGEESARQQAWRAFEALEKLNIVTGGYPAYPARSYCYIADGDHGCGNADGEERWHNSTTMEGYMWKGDTSSDETDGHFAFYPLVYDHVAQTDDEKKRVLTVMNGILGGIIDNDLYLIDPYTNAPTTWGFWNPALVNDDPDHYSERGGNSLGILAYLTSAYSVTRDSRYKDVFFHLVEEHDYVLNAFNAKMDNPYEDNHSDNELNFLAYHTLFYAYQRLLNDPDEAWRKEIHSMVALLEPSIERYWTIVQGEKSPLWLGIYAGTAGYSVDESMVNDATWWLRHSAIDFITWPFKNSDRWDITEDRFFGRDSNTKQMMEIRPAQETRTGHWNGNPFTMDDGSGTSEYEPAIWRLPYYLMRYNKLIS